MKLIATLVISATVLAAQSSRPVLHSVTAVRHWSLSDITRVAVEVSGDFEFRSERLHNPDRIYFDILRATPLINAKRSYTEMINDKLLTKIRVAETLPGVTRVVLDLSGGAEATASQLTIPNRLIIELRAAAVTALPTAPPIALPPATLSPVLKTDPPAPPAKPPAKAPAITEPVETAAARPLSPPPVRNESTGPAVAAPVVKPPSKSPARTESGELSAAPPPVKAPSKAPARTESGELSAVPPPVKAPSKSPARAEIVEVATVSGVKAPAKAAGKTDTAESSTIAAPATTPPTPSATQILAETSKAARRASNGNTSLVRALGLKLGRVVIDPGHGGHDQGTEGPKGMLEKDLVLDVSMRVGKLVEERLGAEVVYTRSDDTFIPLEGRTALAEDKKADLFLSIHANSSPVARISGMETYYLNFTTSRDSLDTASRENASSQKSISELHDLIQTITLHDKAEESREFASRIQSSLYAFSSRNFPGLKDRGVKKAPFVVLIGAKIPSVLVEIGFLSNPREEALLRKPDYRQKLAEALFRGISRYADSLSHFQVAKAGNE